MSSFWKCHRKRFLQARQQAFYCYQLTKLTSSKHGKHLQKRKKICMIQVSSSSYVNNLPNHKLLTCLLRRLDGICGN